MGKHRQAAGLSLLSLLLCAALSTAQAQLPPLSPLPQPSPLPAAGGGGQPALGDVLSQVRIAALSCASSLVMYASLCSRSVAPQPQCLAQWTQQACLCQVNCLLMQAVNIATGIVSAIPGGSDAMGSLLGGKHRKPLLPLYNALLYFRSPLVC